MTELNAEIGRRAAGLASGIHSPTVMGEISKREREIAEISDRLGLRCIGKLEPAGRDTWGWCRGVELN